MKKTAWIAGSLLGASGVALGALGAHALEPVLETEARMATWETGVRYQLYHSLFLLLLGAFSVWYPSGRIRTAIWLTVAGVTLFSGSLYLLSLAQWKVLPVVLATPLGGVCMISAWVLLLISALRIPRNDERI